jgi:hypothetical protein
VQEVRRGRGAIEAVPQKPGPRPHRNGRIGIAIAEPRQRCALQLYLGEIGTRMAMGASTRDILHLVLRERIALVAAGVLSGLIGALAAGSEVGAVLCGVSSTDP